jgi:hypothetical protein
VVAAAAPYIRTTVISEMYNPSDGPWIHESAYGPGVWTLAHRGYSGGGRLDVWVYVDEQTALRAAADLAMSCGLDEEEAAVQRYRRGDYQWIINRYNETSPESHILQVQVANFIDEAGEGVITSAEVDFESPPTSGP